MVQDQNFNPWWNYVLQLIWLCKQLIFASVSMIDGILFDKLASILCICIINSFHSQSTGMDRSQSETQREAVWRNSSKLYFLNMFWCWQVPLAGFIWGFLPAPACWQQQLRYCLCVWCRLLESLCRLSSYPDSCFPAERSRYDISAALSSDLTSK